MISYLVYLNIILAIRILIHYKSVLSWLDRVEGHHTHTMSNITSFLLPLKATFYDLNTVHNTTFNAPMLIIANHQSLLDIPAMGYLFSKNPIRFILKQILSRNIPYCSPVVRLQRQAQINRHNPKQSISEIKKLTTYCTMKKASIMLFPEGTRSKDGKLLEFKTAAIKTILRNNPIPIAVVAIHNTYKFPTATSYKYFPRCNYYVRLLHVFPPVDTKDIPEIIQKSRALIQNQLDEWNKLTQ